MYILNPIPTMNQERVLMETYVHYVPTYEMQVYAYAYR